MKTLPGLGGRSVVDGGLSDSGAVLAHAVGHQLVRALLPCWTLVLKSVGVSCQCVCGDHRGRSVDGGLSDSGAVLADELGHQLVSGLLHTRFQQCEQLDQKNQGRGLGQR
jgi:hypothetical protein